MRHILLLFTLLLFCPNLLCANHISSVQNFKHLSYQDGMGDLTISKITQDKLGFLWIGTYNGLYKYDGIKASHVSLLFEKDNMGNQIDDIAYSASDNILWVVSGERLVRLNLFTETSFEIDKPVDSAIVTLMVDKKGTLWVSMFNGGVYQYANGSWTKLDALGNMRVQEICQVSDTEYGFLSYDNGVVFYDTNTSKKDEAAGKMPVTLSLFVGKEHDIWIGTMNGVYRWNRKTYTYDKIAIQHQSGKDILAVTDIVEISPDQLYLSTDDGLLLLNKQNLKSFRFATEFQDDNTLNCNSINNLFLDKEKTLWIGTFFGGVNYLPENHSNFLLEDVANEKMMGHVVSCFAEDDQHGIWIGTTDGGLSYYHPQYHDVTNYNPQTPEKSFLDYINIQTLLYDQGLLYIGLSNLGVTIYNPLTKSHKKLTKNEISPNSLSCGDVRTLFKLKDGRIAIGHYEGLDIYDPATGNVSAEKGLPKRMVDDISYDKNGDLWLCGEGMGIYHKYRQSADWENFSEKYGLSCSSVYSIADKDSCLYFGTKGEGILCYNHHSKKIYPVLKDALKNYSVLDILPEQDCLWIFTTNGLYQYDLLRNNVHHFTEEDGLKSRRLLIKSTLRTHDGQIYFGTVHGLNSFIPQHIILNDHCPTTVFTRIRVNNEDFIPNSNNGEVKKVVPYLQDITLEHSQNNFSIEFASLSYTGRKENRYRYRIVPYSKDWIYTSSNNINFNHLPAGEYVLTVCSQNSDNVWDEKGCSLRLTILPPWWLSFPMYMVYALLIMGVLFLIFFRYKKKQEKRIQELQLRKNEELYRSRMELFTNVIHDVRTPLTLILTPLENLRKRKEATVFGKELSLMHRNAQRLLQNVNQLMDFRKMEQGYEEPLQLETINVEQYLKEICMDFSGMAQEKGIQLDIHNRIGEPVYLQSDVYMFYKIFTNLISNALKFTKSLISIDITAVDGNCVITVKDNGAGIPLAQQKSLFEQFYQVKRQLPKDYTGTGIGLSIVKRLVECLQGSIRVVSHEGEDCSFEITFPDMLQVFQSMDEPSMQEGVLTTDSTLQDMPEYTATTATNEEKEWTIAVVEDHKDMRDFIRSILKPFYNVDTYENGQILLDNLQEKSVDLIISDVMMPQMDGLTLCHLLKEDVQTRHLPVILLTAKVMQSDEIAGLEMGADAYLRKPFSTDVLLARVRNLIENRLRISEKFQKEPETQWKEVLKKKEDSDFINQLNDIIYRNLNNPELSVPFVAAELGICRTLFYSRMKAISGMTFTDFVRVTRLKKAVEMMKTGNYTLVEISNHLGFSSPSFFTRTFKKQFHITPTEYLKDNPPQE